MYWVIKFRKENTKIQWHFIIIQNSCRVSLKILFNYSKILLQFKRLCILKDLKWDFNLITIVFLTNIIIY